MGRYPSKSLAFLASLQREYSLAFAPDASNCSRCSQPIFVSENE